MINQPSKDFLEDGCVLSRVLVLVGLRGRGGGGGGAKGMEAGFIRREKVPVTSNGERASQRISSCPVTVGGEVRGKRGGLGGSKTMIMDVVNDSRRGGGGREFDSERPTGEKIRLREIAQRGIGFSD